MGESTSILLNWSLRVSAALMAEIRRIAGVTDVRTVPWMPSEREHLALSALLEALPEPVLSVDMKSKVDMANPASCQLFGHKIRIACATIPPRN